MTVQIAWNTHEWEETGTLTGFGYSNWGEEKYLYESALKIQAVLLRCPQERK